MTNVTVGSLDQAADVEPANHIFIETQLPWYRIDEQLPKFNAAEIEGMVNVWKQERGADD
jgi:hypothetical protein